jgi:DNA-binding response OmpR family regulator
MILCIKDDRETVELIAIDVTDRGFDVIVARDGHESFVSILKFIPDLVLCDAGLPLMTGFEVGRPRRGGDDHQRCGHPRFEGRS